MRQRIFEKFAVAIDPEYYPSIAFGGLAHDYRHAESAEFFVDKHFTLMQSGARLI
jgi:hypothetical protein